MDRAVKILAPYILKTIKEKRNESGMREDEPPLTPPASRLTET